MAHNWRLRAFRIYPGCIMSRYKFKKLCIGFIFLGSSIVLVSCQLPVQIKLAFLLPTARIYCPISEKRPARGLLSYICYRFAMCPGLSRIFSGWKCFSLFLSSNILSELTPRCLISIFLVSDYNAYCDSKASTNSFLTLML